MSQPNRLQRRLAKLDRFPAAWRPWLQSWAFGRAVPFVGYVGLRFESLTPSEVRIRLKNRRRVQNHLHQIHAAASMLLVETATGAAIGMNLPDDRLPLLKSFQIRFLQRSQGAQTATVQLNEEQIAHIQAEAKGELAVPVSLQDETGAELINTEAVWAWVPKEKKSAPK